MREGESAAAPEFDELWDYDQPDATRARFEALWAEHGAVAPAPWGLSLRTQIARTFSLTRRFEDAHALLDEVDAALVAADAPLPRLRSLLERGRTFRSAGEAERARPLFLEAWEIGQQIGADALAVDAAHMVALVESGAEALRWNQLALELAERSAEPRAQRWRGSLYNNIAWTLHDEGRYHEALTVFERALAFREAAAKPKPIDIARWCVARCLRSLGRVEEALSLQEALAAGAGDSPGGFTEEELGECKLALGRGDEARPHFERAHALLSQDPWLTEHEPERLARLERLSRGAS